MDKQLFYEIVKGCGIRYPEGIYPEFWAIGRTDLELLITRAMEVAQTQTKEQQ